MSAWSDWKCEALTDEEYRDLCAYENRVDRAEQEEIEREMMEDEEDDE